MHNGWLMPLVLLLWETVFLVAFEAGWIFQRVTLTLVWIIWVIKKETNSSLDKKKKKKKKPSCTGWNIWGKYFLFSIFMLLCHPHQILNVVALVKETSFFSLPRANGWEKFLSRNNTKIICLWVYKILEGFFSPLHLWYYFSHFTNMAGSILTALQSERRLTLCNHTGAEPGTDKSKNPINLTDTLACAWTKTMLRRRHYWRDHTVPALPPSRQFPRSLQLCGLTIPQKNDRK